MRIVIPANGTVRSPGFSRRRTPTVGSHDHIDAFVNSDVLPAKAGTPNHRFKAAATNGFTMVEIAIAVAVIAFALVAIIGVLPAGLQVQKENREDTLMAQDGTYWMEAIRNGSVGLDDLTNYVEQIKVGGTNRPFSSGQEIIGLL